MTLSNYYNKTGSTGDNIKAEEIARDELGPLVLLDLALSQNRNKVIDDILEMEIETEELIDEITKRDISDKQLRRLMDKLYYELDSILKSQIAKEKL